MLGDEGLPVVEVDVEGKLVLLVLIVDPAPMIVAQ
jgi:hypothetical protein